MLGKALDAFLDSPLSGITPWAFMAMLAGPGRYEFAVIVALGFSLVVLGLSWLRGIPVHVLEVVGVSYFVVLAAIGLVVSDGTKSWLEMWAGEITNASLALFALITLLLRRPYTMAYARDVTPPEVWSTPFFRRANMVLTGVWAGAFGFSATVGFIGDVVYGDTDNFWTGWVLQLASLFFAVALTRFYPEYARAREHSQPLPSRGRVFDWLPPFLMGTGIAGWLLGAVAAPVSVAFVAVGALGIVVLRRRHHSVLTGTFQGSYSSDTVTPVGPQHRETYATRQAQTTKT